jgi:hypothetical protein
MINSHLKHLALANFHTQLPKLHAIVLKISEDPGIQLATLYPWFQYDDC